MGTNFIASASKKSNKLFRDKIKAWINYFGRYNAQAIKYSLDCVERRLVRWAMFKFKRFRGHRRMADKWLSEVRKK